MGEGTKERRRLRAMSKAIGFCAIIWIIGTFVWYVFSKHWDPNIFLIYLMVGVGGIGLSGICEWILRVKIDSKKDIKQVKDELIELKDGLIELDKTVSSLSNWVKNKIDKIDNNNINSDGKKQS